MLRLISFILIMVNLAIAKKAMGCTSFCLYKDSTIYLAKNLDWDIESGYVFLNESNVKKYVLEPGTFNCHAFSWMSKYRNITFNQFGKEFPLGGMNEKGLVVEELNMAPVDLLPDSTKHPINEFQITQYLLDNCATTTEVAKQLQYFQQFPLFLQLHYIIADRQGRVLIVEFNGSGFKLNDANKTGLPVLTNNNYLESLKYLKNFNGFGGNIPVQNRPGSNERFVSVANMLSEFKDQEPVSFAFQVLDVVKQDDTRWSIVYDNQRLEIHFKFHDCSRIKRIDLEKILGRSSFGRMGGNLQDCDFVNHKGLNEVTQMENTILLQKVLAQYAELSQNEMPEKLFIRMAALSREYLKPDNFLQIMNGLDYHVLILEGIFGLRYLYTFYITCYYAINRLHSL